MAFPSPSPEDATSGARRGPPGAVLDTARRPRTIEVEWVRAAFVRPAPLGKETAEKGHHVDYSLDEEIDVLACRVPNGGVMLGSKP